jgi:hypothetical protein
MKKIIVIFLFGSSLTYGQVKDRKERSYRRLEYTYVALNTIDLATTFYVLDNGGREMNPILKPFAHNKPLLTAVKATGTFSTLFLLRKMKKTDPELAKGILIGMNIMYGAVVTNNVSISIKIK